jgi:hypothetical protein
MKHMDDNSDQELGGKLQHRCLGVIRKGRNR